jgi:hypothetical protein
MKKEKKDYLRKIYLEADKNGKFSTAEISGTFDDLVYLISIAIAEVPEFIDVVKLAIDFTEHTKNKKVLLQKAYDFCIDNDKSTEFMLQYMQDVADVDLEYVLSFLEESNWFFNKSSKN